MFPHPKPMSREIYNLRKNILNNLNNQLLYKSCMLLLELNMYGEQKEPEIYIYSLFSDIHYEMNNTNLLVVFLLFVVEF